MAKSAERMRALRERERRGLSSLPAGFDSPTPPCSTGLPQRVAIRVAAYCRFRLGGRA